jgi:hypothetical protein
MVMKLQGLAGETGLLEKDLEALQCFGLLEMFEKREKWGEYFGEGGFRRPEVGHSSEILDVKIEVVGGCKWGLEGRRSISY